MAATQRRVYHCALCGRTLPHERWVYSRHTNSRYCTTGEGCATPAAINKRAAQVARRKEKR